MSFIGEAIATAAISVLLKNLASTKLLRFASRENIHADLKKWEKKLRKIKAVLNDAAEKQLESQSVRDWLSDLKNLAYDMEDILDEFATEALKRELLDEPHASTSKVQKLIPSCCTGFNPSSVMFNVKMASQIKEVTDRLEEIVEQKNFLELKEIPGEKSSKGKYQSSPASTSLHDPYLCGRENDKKAILDMLFKDEGTSTSVGVPVISIFGMGGLGKTTLAQLVYNDKDVDTYFNFKAWTYISEDFDIARVTKIVLQSIASGTGDGNDLNLLQVQLEKKLAGKKFLIVLDDVWHEMNYQDWTKFCLPFQAGSFGSKIIFTTRKESVALMAEANNGSIYRLTQLSNDNCLSLFTFHALGRTDFNKHPDLKEIGEKIVDRCKGLPLAAKTLGGLLRCKFRNKDWEDLLDSRIWNLSAEESGILPALRVSYNYLSPPLQRCFAYCSIFPKGYKFEKKEIILLWMAEGFLQMDRNEKQAEDIGDEFFENLYSISFFQQIRSIYFSRFVMHDLIHDLAQWAAEDFCLKVENVSKDEKKLKISKNLHHLSFVNVGSICECIKKLEASDEVIKSIRTFLPLPLAMPLFLRSPCDFLYLLPKLRRLRVLSLKGYHIENLPNTISDLKHLRYLDLSNTEIEKLPDSINTLYNLEILKLGCSYLVNLCSDMGHLINLRHLYIPKASLIERMPLGIGQLICLRTLPFYLVGKDVGFGLKELKKLTHLQEKFWISGLENVKDIGDAKEADIIGKEKLRELELEWTSNFSDSRDIGTETKVLEMLQPYNKLEKLTIMSYGGTKFPSWLADTSLSKLVFLRFEDCKNCTSLPPIGQLPLLKDLYLIGLAGIKSISPEFYGNGCSTPFQSLEFLHIEDMQEWKDWNHLGYGKDNVGFPRLRELSIDRCPKLLGNFPEHLPLLERLSINSCEQLWMSIPLLDCMIPDAEDGFPSNFTSLIFEGVNISKTFFEGGLHRLTSLEVLTISGGCPDMISFPMLPTSLTRLCIFDFRNLERLSPNFQDLSSLEVLELRSCPNLKFFPEKGLPSSLQKLWINECPLLKQRCEKDKGLYWPMIALVPEVYIDNEPKWEYGMEWQHNWWM